MGNYTGTMPPTRDDCNLARIRKQRGYTQTLIENKVGLTHGMINKYERGHSNINTAPAEILLLISRFLDCTIEDIMQPERIRKREEKQAKKVQNEPKQCIICGNTFAPAKKSYVTCQSEVCKELYKKYLYCVRDHRRGHRKTPANIEKYREAYRELIAEQ